MNNLSVGQRLAILVALPLAIILVIVVSSLSSFAKINAGVGVIYDARVVPLTELKKVNDAYGIDMVTAINKATIGMMTPAEAYELLTQAERQARENLAAYQKLPLSPEERKLVDEIATHTDKALRRVSAAANLLQPLGDSMALNDNGDPVIMEYNGDLYEYIDPITSRLQKLIDMQLDGAKQERVAAQKIYDTVFMAFIAVAVVAAAVMVLFGGWVARSISRPLSALRNAIESTERNRDLTVRVGIDQNDEIGSVAHAFEAMVSQKPYRNSMIGYAAMKNLLSDNSRRFDPDVLKAFVRSMGIYPIGSIVVLNNAAIARVVDTHADAPLRPRLKIIVDEFGKHFKDDSGDTIDLLAEKSLFIARAVDPRELSASA